MGGWWGKFLFWSFIKNFCLFLKKILMSFIICKFFACHVLRNSYKTFVILFNSFCGSNTLLFIKMFNDENIKYLMININSITIIIFKYYTSYHLKRSYSVSNSIYYSPIGDLFNKTQYLYKFGNSNCNSESIYFNQIIL